MAAMTIGRAAVAASACVLVLAADTPAADDPAAALKSDVDALAKMLDDRWGGRDDDGPSPTARVNRLVAAGDARLRPVLADAWKAVAGPTSVGGAERYRNAVRQLARFLYSLADTGKTAAQGDDELVEEDGVVRIRKGDPTGGFGWKGWKGGGFGRKNDESSPPLADLLKGGKLRKAAKPDVKKALAALDVGKTPESERAAVAKALGEACATNKPGLADLLRRQDADPADRWLMTALAWTGAPDAERPLRTEIESLAPRVAEGKTAAAPILATACWALKRVRRDALVEEVGKLTGPAREAALAASGPDFATSLDLAAIEKASDPAARDALVLAACRRISAADGDARPSPATLTALTKLLAPASASTDATLREAALAAAETLFFAFNRYPIDDGDSSTSGDRETRTKRTGERLGPYPDMAALLASLGRDVDAGDVVFYDEAAATIFDAAPAADAVSGKALFSDVKCPDPRRYDAPAEERAPLKLQGVFVAEGLRLTLTNVGAAPLAVDPVALRYGSAEITTEEFTGSPGGAAKYRQLKLALGFLRTGVATPSARLVVLAPKECYAWTAAVRPEHRGVDHVCVELEGTFSVRGKAPAARIASFDDTWVK